MVVGRNNGVVGLTGFSDKKMSGLFCSGHKKVVAITGWSYQRSGRKAGFHCSENQP